MNRQKGRTGEERAAAWLVDNGYTIISRNYQCRQGEIDCIARDPAGVLVFFEVKAAWRSTCGNPLFRITRSKQLTIARLATRYLSEHQITDTPCRFDVISVCGGTIDHIKNAFLA